MLSQPNKARVSGARTLAGRSRRVVNIGVIGCGHWGPNHIRVFAGLDRSCVVACADTRPAQLTRIAERFKDVHVTTDYRDLLADPNIDAVVVATPTCTHAEIAGDALDAGKHVLVEKPLALTTIEARRLTDKAHAGELVLMVGHVFLYNNGIIKLKELISRGELGRIHYLDAVRTNLGPVRGDVNALYDLGTHDISIFNYLLDAIPVEVAAHGSCISQRGIEDVCFAALRYPGGTLAHIHVSWLNPRKVRTMTVVGQRKMAHWDDVDPSETLRLHDKGLEEPPYYDSFGEFQCLLRNADVQLPKIDLVEPLVNQAKAFLDTVLDGAACRSGGAEAEAIIAVLQAAQRSLQNAGRFFPVVPQTCGPAKSADSRTVTSVLPDMFPPTPVFLSGAPTSRPATGTGPDHQVAE